MRRLPDKVKPIQIKQMNNLTMRQDTREPMNEITKETPGSPIAQQNIETRVLTPIQTQQVHSLKNWTFQVIFGSPCTCS
ncbi:unnamed protein product [Brassica oleracea]